MDKWKEKLSVVDESEGYEQYAFRKRIHRQNLLHREVAVFIRNNIGEILLQQRVDNQMLSASIGEHVRYEESYIDAAYRGLKEEIGIDISYGLEYRGKILLEESNNRCFIENYSLNGDFNLDDFTMDQNEVLDLKFYTREDIFSLLMGNASEAIQMEGRTKLLLKSFLENL